MRFDSRCGLPTPAQCAGPHAHAQGGTWQDLAAEQCSLPYRAPELVDVASHCVLTTAIDMWSLGCLVYFLAFQETPFERLVATGAHWHLQHRRLPAPPNPC
jgi:serine/threonine protein kinase